MKPKVTRIKLPDGVLPKRRHKYGAKRTTVNGISFASKKEADHYLKLHYLEKAGAIFNLRCQTKFALFVKGVDIGTYVADFTYYDKFQEDYSTTLPTNVVDVKGCRTQVYKLKKKLVEALFHFQIQEI